MPTIPKDIEGDNPAWSPRRFLAPILVLSLLVFGGLSHDGRRAVEKQLATGAFHLTPANAFRAVRAYLSNEDDMYRCHAYAQAILGRPYRSYFVRTRSGWDATFASGVQEDPDATEIVRPSTSLRPYRDFFVEYPPGFLLVLLPPALLATTADGYALAFKIEMAIFLLMSLFAARGLARPVGLADRARAALPGHFAAAVLALGVVCTHRYDAFVAAGMALGILAAARGRPAIAGLWLGIAISAKGVPLLILPLVAMYVYQQSGRRAAARMLSVVCAAAGGLLAATWWWCGSGVFEAFAYHGMRPVQIESTWGAILSTAAWFEPGLVTVVHSYSSRNLRGGPVEMLGAIAGVITLLVVAVMLVVLVRRLRAAGTDGARLATVIDGAVALLAAYMALGKVFCPQYLVWILPLALVAAKQPGRRAGRARAGLAILVATHLIYPLGYAAVKALALWASLLVLMRDLALLTWSASLLRPNDRNQPGAGN